MNQDQARAYEDFVATIATYPHAGESTLGSLIYPTLGLTGETGEMLEKLASHRRGLASDKDLLKELGDCLWYLTRCAVESGTTLPALLTMPAMGHEDGDAGYLLAAAGGQVAERMKKALRDDDSGFGDAVDEGRLAAIRDDLYVYLNRFLSLLEECHFTLAEVADANVAKLSKRRDKGIIKGDGDNREE